jgi:aminoacyl tRNA synthase complex-interacting multifunctional protein 1
MATFG